MKTSVLRVPNISCGHCEKSITEAIEPLKGVGSIKVDVSLKQVKVTYDQSILNIRTIEEMLDSLGYPIDVNLETNPKNGAESRCCGSCH